MNVVYATDDFFSAFYPMLGGKVVGSSKDIQEADLVVFTGGEDVNPFLYGEENKRSYFNPQRDSIEVGVFNLAYTLDKKMLGVCRGHQILNVLLGGKLTQDLFHPGRHLLEWISDTDLREVLPPVVNSMHHQGFTLEQASACLIPVATHSGIVEATLNNQFLTTQFHPEFMAWKPLFDYVRDVWMPISSK